MKHRALSNRIGQRLVGSQYLMGLEVGMRIRSIWKSGLIVTFILAMTGAGAQTRANGDRSWLDKPLLNWNITIREIPKAPKPDVDLTGRCAGARLPDSAEDRAITAKGWWLLGSPQRFEKTLIISANADADGQCRPLSFQDFVFVDGQFVGTISPLPMNSRADAAVDAVRFTSASNFVADFRRYAASDPLCCPSQTSSVTFQIEERNGKRILVPQSRQTVSR
jgi:hypothetical protein